MLKQIYIDGFRHFKNFILVPKHPHTLLCGFNGTGKTTVLEVISRLQAFIVGSNAISELYDEDSVPRWEEKEYGTFISTLGFSIKHNSDTFDYMLTIKYNFKEKVCRVEEESLFLNSTALFSSKVGEATVTSDDKKVFTYPIDWSISSLQVSSRKNSKIRDFISYIQKNMFVLSINPFLDYFEGSDTKDFLEFNCDNFSEWYGKLLDDNITAVVNSFDSLKPFIKGFKQFSYLPNGGSKDLYVTIQKEGIQKHNFHFNELSHGQKILCILYLVLHTCPENSVILIDEFENFLSPVELQPLYNLIQDVYEEKNVQCILVSHHQKTLNWFQDSAFVFSYSSDGTFIRLKDFSEETNISIDDYLFNNQED